VKLIILTSEKNTTVHLVPEPQKQLCELQHALEQVFPFCDDLSKKSETGFKPHLTLGQATTAGLNNLKTKINDTLKLDQWKVNEVCIISRTGESPFEILHRVKLGTKQQPQPKNQKRPNKVPSTTPEPNTVNPPNLPNLPKPQKPQKSPKPPSVDQSPAFPSKIPETIPPAHFRFSPQEFYPKLQKRFIRWTIKLKDISRLPKTKSKLINSIKPFCVIRYSVISPEYIYARLYEQNYLDIDEDEGLILVHRKFEGFPSPENGLAHWTNELNELQLDAVTKCFNWVSTLKIPPKSFWALRHSIDQLCFAKGEIDASAFVEYLYTKKIIALDGDDTVTYYLDQKFPWSKKKE